MNQCEAWIYDFQKLCQGFLFIQSKQKEPTFFHTQSPNMLCPIFNIQYRIGGNWLITVDDSYNFKSKRRLFCKAKKRYKVKEKAGNWKLLRYNAFILKFLCFQPTWVTFVLVQVVNYNTLAFIQCSRDKNR